MATHIRQATVADVKPLIALARRTITAAYSPFLGDVAVAGYIDSGAVDQYVADSIARCAVIVVNESVVGFSVTSDNLIDLMMIDATCHRSGLGTRLLIHTENELFTRFDALVLESFKDNASANAFYRHHGWSEARTFHDDASGVDKIKFRKSRVS